VCVCVCGVGIKPRALPILGKYSATELHPQPSMAILKKIFQAILSSDGINRLSLQVKI
jgi:hypothetical protein